MHRCVKNPSMECHEAGRCFLQSDFFCDKISKYLQTTLLKSSNFQPITSLSSDFKNAKEDSMLERAEIALCIDDEELMVEHFRTGKVNRRICDAFQSAGKKFLSRWDSVRDAA